MCRKTYILLIGLVSLTSVSFAQITDEQLKATLILHICENVEWPDPIIDTFLIGYFNEDQGIYEQLKDAERTIKLHSRPIKIVEFDNIGELEDCHGIYYKPDSDFMQKEIFNIAKMNSILVITDNFEDELFTFVNFSESNGSVEFSVNMTNLTLAGLEITPNLLLNGGNVVDIQSAYEKFELRLVEIRNSYEQTLQELNIKERELEAKEGELASKDRTILQRESELDDQWNLVKEFEVELAKLQEQTDEYVQALSQKDMQLTQKDKQLASIQGKINLGQIELEALEEEIGSLISESTYLKEEVNQKNIVLDEQEIFILSQKRQLKFILAFSIALIIAGLSMLRVYFIRKKYAQKLQFVNEELSEKNDTIIEQNTELLFALENLKEAQVQLLQSEKMASLGILTAGVAHEINNPLNFIMGAYEGLSTQLKGTENEDTSSYLYALDEGIKRVSDIIQSLGQFSRKNESKNENCNPCEIIDNCLVIMHNKLKGKVVVEKNYPSENPVFIRGNGGNLHQLFLNILSNAEQAIHGKGSLSIRVFDNNDHIEIQFSDDGEGISEENLSKITEPFFTTKEPGKGVGLGLSIVYNIIKSHKGTINFHSVINEGTTVSLCFPVTE